MPYKKTLPLVCKNCGQGYMTSPEHVAADGSSFCSRRCQTDWRRNQPPKFWEKVLKLPSGCWLWTAGKNKAGYGQFTMKKKMIGAHRLAWVLTNGEPTQGLFVLHRCDNPACVNPSHLFLGTARDNLMDCLAKGRFRIGQACHSNKLRPDDIRQIRADEGLTQKQLAAKYGVTQHMIWKIKRFVNWKHIV